MARPGTARLDGAGLGTARQGRGITHSLTGATFLRGTARRGWTGLGVARSGKARQGHYYYNGGHILTWLGPAGQGGAWHWPGLAGRGRGRYFKRGTTFFTRPGGTRWGVARHGVLWRGVAWQGRGNSTISRKGSDMTLVFASKGDQPKWVPLYDAARTADPGELITYDRLVEILGEDIRDTNRYPIDAARKHLERDSHRTLVAVPNEGYRVSQAEEHAGLARWHQRKSRRQIKKALSKTISADRSQLARDQLTLLDALELHLQRQAEFLRRTAERVAIVETVQTDQIEKSTAHEERIRVLERRLARFLAEE